MKTKVSPIKFSRFLQKLKNRIKSNFLLRSNEICSHYCPVCETSVKEFDRLPDEYYEKLDTHGFIFSIFQFETLNQLKYLCPNCGASDRDRLYAIYLNSECNKFLDDKSFLDIAPSQSLRTHIAKKYPRLHYRTADLGRSDVDDVVDVTDMNIYGDNSFNFFICSHVLEHVVKDIKAMQELYRILDSQGRGIVMAPIMLSLDEDYEDSEIVDPSDRWKHFGQDDHVRMYSKQGFLKKLSSVGFSMQSLDISFFGEEVFYKYGIHPRSVLYVVSK